MNRTPPLEVRQELRREVGFGCPIAGCGSPYLMWHHFDPPWHVREHHDPSGMIALCTEHHAKADFGSWSVEQLHEIKLLAAERAPTVVGRFDWLRRDLLALVGGCFYYETPVILEIRGHPVIFFNRDHDGHLLLNAKMPTTSGRPRLVLEDQYFTLHGEAEDLECPPSGRLLKATYPNGDALRVEFFELTEETARQRYPDRPMRPDVVHFPITAVEIHLNVANTALRFGPRETNLGGNTIRNGFMIRCGVGIAIS